MHLLPSALFSKHEIPQGALTKYRNRWWHQRDCPHITPLSPNTIHFIDQLKGLNWAENFQELPGSKAELPWEKQGQQNRAQPSAAEQQPASSGGSQLPQAHRWWKKPCSPSTRVKKPTQFWNWDIEVLTCIQRQNRLTKRSNKQSLLWKQHPKTAKEQQNNDCVTAFHLIKLAEYWW